MCQHCQQTKIVYINDDYYTFIALNNIQNRLQLVQTFTKVYSYTHHTHDSWALSRATQTYCISRSIHSRYVLRQCLPGHGNMG